MGKTTPQTTPDSEAAPAPAAPEFQAITSQEDLDRIIGDRVARERRKYADYEDLKARAARLDDAEARLAAIDAEKQQSEWKDAAAAEYGVPASVLRGSTQEEVTAHAKALKEALRGRTIMPVIPGQGKTPEGGSDNGMRALARDLFGN